MIVFENDGTLDKRAVTTFGVSSKEGDTPIGYFGTGLKYAIAILLREGCRVEISTGGEVWKFDTIDERIRVDDFKTVTLNGERLSFTTELGKNWHLWQAYREIYCNCVDEPGSQINTAPDANLVPNTKRTFVAVFGKKFEQIHHKRDSIILEREDEPVCSLPVVGRVYKGDTKVVFYRGVRAYDLNMPCMYTYNIEIDTDLTEDRTIKYEYMIRLRMAKLTAQSRNKEQIRAVIMADDSWYESHLDFEVCSGTFTHEFAETVRECAREKPSRVNRSAMKLIDFSIADLLPDRSKELDNINARRFEKAMNFLRDIGFDPAAYPIIVIDHLENGLLGMAKDGKIYITMQAFEMGTKYLAGTILEEVVHLSRGVQDCTREMQNVLIDVIVSLGENIHGEPL